MMTDERDGKEYMYKIDYVDQKSALSLKETVG